LESHRRIWGGGRGRDTKFGTRRKDKSNQKESLEGKGAGTCPEALIVIRGGEEKSKEKEANYSPAESPMKGGVSKETGGEKGEESRYVLLREK